MSETVAQLQERASYMYFSASLECETPTTFTISFTFLRIVKLQLMVKYCTI